VPASSKKVRTLAKLTPTEFENLIFDLLVLTGMANVRWRTPGADGGRDIEGETVERDLSGAQVVRKWFVECKRYAKSVDWPTIYSKLSYADSLNANFLLMCTTAKFSPQALTHVDAWNANHRPVVIRLWAGHDLQLQLRQHADLLLKYRLTSAPSVPGQSFLALSLALSKTVSSHHSRLVFSGKQPDLMLQAAQAFSELLTRRMDDLNREGSISVTFPHGLLKAQPLVGCTFYVDSPHVDEAGLRAFAAYLVALCGAAIAVRPGSNARTCVIASSVDLGKVLSRYQPAFGAIAMWSNIEFESDSKQIKLRQRT
jgi:hypothetical protein